MKGYLVLLLGILCATAYGQEAARREYLGNPASNDFDLEEDGPGVELEVIVCPDGWAGKNCRYKLFGRQFDVPYQEWGNGWPYSQPMCSIYGHSSIFTFDGHMYESSGHCKYTAVRRISPEEDQAPFEISVTRNPFCTFGDCIVEIEIIVESYEIRLRPDRTEIMISDYIVTLWDRETYENEDISITYEYNMRAVVLLGGQVVVLYNEHSDMYVHLINFEEETAGICGDSYSGRSEDYYNDPNFIKNNVASGCTETYEMPVAAQECLVNWDVREACTILAVGELADCNRVINPTNFLRQCVREMCLCNYLENEHCLCDIAAQYARTCAFANVPIRSWRQNAPACLIPCSDGMEWTECGGNGITTCRSASVGTISTTCVAQCQCPEGLFFNEDEFKCVSIEDCACYYQNSLYYSGQTRSEDCNKCFCSNGRWECEDKVCNATAWSYGNHHYKTFDGQYFTHPEDCLVLLAGDEVGDFAVFVQTFTDGAKYQFEKDVHVMTRMDDHIYHYKLGRGGQLFIHIHGVYGTDGMEQIKLPELRPGIAAIERYGERGFHVQLFKSKTEIRYDGIGFVVVKVSAEYANKVKGLGGNFNGIRHDDMMLPSREVAVAADFVASWRKDPTCVSTSYYDPIQACDDFDVLYICERLTDDTNFECGSFIDLDLLKSHCILDTCNGNPEYNYVSSCRFAKSAMSICEDLGAYDESVTGLYNDICPVVCPSHKVFSNCSSDCKTSCETLGSYCINQCFSGCFCPTGTYENHDGSCVLADDCSCFYEGEVYDSDSTTTFETKTCTCNGGIMLCSVIEGSGETLDCEGDLVHYDCVTTRGASLTCAQPFTNYLVDECTPKCGCPPGLFLDMESKCVRVEECGCMGANNKHFNSGESYLDDCNVCTCIGGIFECTNDDCPKVCSSSGGSHYQTFDGLMYDFHGECEYILASDYCSNNEKGGLFSIVTKNVKCGTAGLTCSKSVIVTIKNKQIELIKGEAPAQRDLPNTRFRRAVTGFTDYREAEIFTVKQKGLFTEISTCIGITVLWDNGTRVYVRLTPEYKGSVCGLCGNYDGIDNNDYVTSSGILGDAIEFGNSWKLPQSSLGCKDATRESQVNNTCVLNPSRKVWAEESCEVILDDKLFGECHSKINPKKFYDDCVLDACGCDAGGDCECRCTAVANYAHQCAQKGVVVEWRNMKRCPLMCEIYNAKQEDCQWHYRACDSCITDTCCECKSHEDDNWCVEGCFPKCPEGKILDEMTQKCVSAENKEEECTRYSNENMCRVCEPCNVCKTKEGAILRVLPGETKYFPLDTDTCEKETCVNTTAGDLCYNGTVRVYSCVEEYREIPEHDPNFYKIICVNSTTSECKNCRDCEKECIIREDSCEVGKEKGDRWQRIFAFNPVPQTGPKTYCVNYECLAHPSALEPECSLQKNETQKCLNTGEDKECQWFEELKPFGTEDPCCPLKWECVCVTCQHSNGTYDPTIEVNQFKEKCADPAVSNCCYRDTCYPKTEEPFCPQVVKTTDECPPPPDTTCPPGHVWVNNTREKDCCPVGECVCDSCTDYDIYGKKTLRAVGSKWNKNCLKFACTPDVRGEDGCFETLNYENVTCNEITCPPLMKIGITGKDNFGCCDLFQCECKEQCYVSVNGTQYAYEPDVEWTGEDGCYYRCFDPKQGLEGPFTDPDDCPNQEKICRKPVDCPTCHKIVGEEDDGCGCTKYICEEIKRCPVIECPYPYQRNIVPSDPCTAPCFDCTCDHLCWDQFNNKTYYPAESWRREYRTPERKCEDCVCNNDLDEDGCLKEECTRVPCKEIEACPSPYDVAVTGIDECGCTYLIECKCMYCKLGDEVLKEEESGSSWEVGNTDLGCYDTYTCLNLKDIGKDLECFNVTKERNPCPVPIECPENYRRVKDEEKSCCYPDGDECCDHFKCECIVCLFGDDEIAYNVGDTWTDMCKNYVCNDTIDPTDVNKCYKEQYTIVPCLEKRPECNDCYEEYLKQERTVPEFCCDIYDCKPELYCTENNTRIAENGTEWYDKEEDPNGCIKKRCYVSEDDWAKGICPVPVNISPCMSDFTECEKCENKTIVKDICGCDKVTCPPLNPPVECVDPKANQRIVTLATNDMCFPSKNCCICENECVYKGQRKKLYDTWWDKETCQRLRCVVPTDTLSTIPDVDEEDWDSIRRGLDYRAMMVATRKASYIYDECEQLASLCPTVLDVGCPDLIPCKECQTTTVVKDSCNCDVNVCKDYVCPPYPYNVTECSPPRSKLIEVSLNGLHEYFPCCPTGNKCVCPDGCFSLDGTLQVIGAEWDEVDESGCGSKRRFTCRAATPEDDNECPQIEIVPCVVPTACPSCFVTIDSKDEYCCDQVDCIKMTCNVTTQKDCEDKYFPFTVMKTDAVKTKNECCPHYCDCPDVCVDEFNGEEHDKNEKWLHPNSQCWDRFCLVDKTKAINQGCPYIENRTVCVEPEECEKCFHKVDEIDPCGCTLRKCVRDDCPVPECTDECKEIVDTGVRDDCDCPVLECRLKVCPPHEVTCDDDEMDIYSWMDKKINKCCKQYGCRCNYTKCDEPQCKPNEVLVRNITVQKCCCPEYNCVDQPPKEDYCTFGGEKKPIGQRWISADNVCKEMQCTYENARSKKTKIDVFNRYSCMVNEGTRSKRATTCANAESPYWATTKNGCCRESVCPCSCQLYGDPHYKTFDGFSFDFQGKCTYTLMKEYRFNETEILVDNELCKWWRAKNQDLSCLKTLTVLHKKSNYTFSFGQNFYLNGVLQNVNAAWESEDKEVRVEEYAYKTLQMKIVPLGINMIYKTMNYEQSLVLVIPYETYEGQMSGLCGTCNNDQSDDFIGRNKERWDASNHENINKFGASWMSSYVKDVDHANCVPAEPVCPDEPEYPDCPSTYPSDECVNCENRCFLGHTKCSTCDTDPCEAITIHEVFEECRVEVDGESYLPQCQFDVSLLTNSTEVKCNPCNSATVKQFATMCEVVGSCAPWRSALDCATPECPETQEFRECDKNALKYRSCDNLTVWDDGIRVEGCFCPEGQVRKTATSSQCVPAQCCFECPQAPTCEEGEQKTQGEDECGCPIYYCEVSSGPGGDCSPQSSVVKGLVIYQGGKFCMSLATIDTNLCGGLCSSSSTISTQGTKTNICTSCKPTATGLSTKSINLSCSGTTDTADIEFHTECECQEIPCE